ncbi:phage tail protein [Thalassospira sp. CH_XMU1458]|uniref:phage tail protein n=1 Tax=Thalassospira sp. CH_XMU1458 TaxID=3107776 RepID=UPI00300CE758
MQCLSPVESEVLNVVLAAEIVPDRMDDTQLLQALETLFGGGSSGGGAVPVATILSFAGSLAPEGFMICDGAELLAADYADLFTAIGTTYGVGQAAGSFKLPDLRGRAPIGAGQGDGLTDRVIGAAGGEETHQLTVDEMPNHTHQYGAPHLQTYGMGSFAERGLNPTSQEWYSVSDAGGDQPHNNMQPFLVVNYIIKV